jgi:hypothetical protein
MYPNMKVAFSCATIFLIVATQTGCTALVRTEALPATKASQVPSSRLLAYQQEKAGDTRLIVTRDRGFMASGCFLALAIEGTIAARFDPEETATFFVPNGKVQMAVVPDPSARGLCSVNSWDPVLDNYELKVDGRNSFRISLGAYRRPRVVPSVY